MRSFKVKQAIGSKVFFYVQVYYFGIPWRTLSGGIFGAMVFKKPKDARAFIETHYGKSAIIKTTW